MNLSELKGKIIQVDWRIKDTTTQTQSRISLLQNCGGCCPTWTTFMGH